MKVIFLAILLLFNSRPSLGATQVLPGLNTAAAPVPAPTLPSYYDSFAAPTSTSAPVAGSPIFAEWIHQAEPGDTILFTGSKLSGFTFFGQTQGAGQLLTAAAVFQDTLQTQISLPLGLPPNSTYLVWSSNANGTSTPACLNCTELWWGEDTVLPGDTAPVFGRNFFYGGITPTVYVAFPGQMGTVAQLVDYNNYRIDYVMPSNLNQNLGSVVQVWVHNGHGAVYGWSGPISVTLAATVNDDTFWSGTTFNVQNFGATGNGVTDDGPAILMALTTAAQSYASSGNPATVYLPGSVSGTVYLTNEGFDNLAGVRWMGDGKMQTILRLGPLFADEAMFYETTGQPGHGNNVEIRDMTLDINGNLQGTNAAANGYHMLLEDSVNFFKLYNLAIYSGEPLSSTSSDSLIFKGIPAGSHAWVQDCDVYGGQLGFQAQSQVFIDRCAFFGQYDAGCFVGSNGGIGFSMTSCTAQDFNYGGDPTVDPNPNYFDGRLFAGGGNCGDRDTYIAGNTTIECAPRVGGGHSGNAGEQVLWESGDEVRYTGTPVSAGPSTVQISASPTSYGADGSGRYYYYVVVTAGDGLGQDRLVVADNGSGLLSVSPNWNVVPDATSTIQVQPANEKAVVYLNQLQGKPGYLTSGTSSAGVQPYLDCFGFVVDSNVISQTVHGLYMWSSIDQAGLHPGYFDLFINNSVSNSSHGATTNYDNFGTAVPGVALLGVDMRRNNFNNSSVGTMLDGFTEQVTDTSTYSPRIASTLVDQNSAAYLSATLVAPLPTDSRIYQTFISGNNFCTGSEPCITASMTVTVVPTKSATPSATCTTPPSPSCSLTPSFTPTATETWTATLTATISSTQSSSAMPSVTATYSDSMTTSPSSSPTPSTSPSAPNTATASPTPTFTASPGPATYVLNGLTYEVAPGTVFYSTLDNNVADLSGNNNNLIIAGSPSFPASAPPGFKTAAGGFNSNGDNYFSGSSGLNTLLQGLNSFTVEFYVLGTGTSTCSDLINFGSSTSNFWGISPCIPNYSAFYWAITQAGVQQQINGALSSNYLTSQWYFMSMNYSAASGLMKIYVNGTLMATSSSFAYTPFTNSPFLTIGKDGLNNTGVSSNLNISQLRVLNYAKASGVQTNDSLLASFTPTASPTSVTKAVKSSEYNKNDLVPDIRTKLGLPSTTLPQGRALLSVPNPATDFSTALFSVDSPGRVMLVLGGLEGGTVFERELGELSPGVYSERMDLGHCCPRTAPLGS